MVTRILVCGGGGEAGMFGRSVFTPTHMKISLHHIHSGMEEANNFLDIGTLSKALLLLLHLSD